MADCQIGDALRARITAAWPDILAGIAAGELVRDVLGRAGVKYANVTAYLRDDPPRRVEWDDAREQSAEAFIDEAMEVARTRREELKDSAGKPVLDKDGQPVIVPIDAAHARTRIDTLKWAARIRNPRAYSDKAQLDVNVKTIDLTQIITEANARLLARSAGRVIEHDAGAAIEGQASKLLQLL